MTEKDKNEKCDCSKCDREECVHRWAFRRHPHEVGGLGLCPNLSEEHA